MSVGADWRRQTFSLFDLAGFTPFRIIFQTLIGEKQLLPGRKHKFFTTINTSEHSVNEFVHVEPPGLLSSKQMHGQMIGAYPRLPAIISLFIGLSSGFESSWPLHRTTASDIRLKGAAALGRKVYY
jgi:hypothetical protein